MILSGRNGTPLWTMSRELYPKQLLSLLGELSLPQETAWRVHGHGLAPAVVVCGEPHRFINAEQLRNLSIRPAKIVLDPWSGAPPRPSRRRSRSRGAIPMR